MSECTFKSDGYHLQITTQSLETHRNQNNNSVRLIDYIESVMNAFHEERHIMQQKSFRKQNADDITIKLAKADILRLGLPEAYSYKNNYWNNPCEIDAELYAIKETLKYFQKTLPEENIEPYITAYIQNIQTWYADNHVTNVKQAITNLETKLEQELESPSPIELPFDHQNHKGEPIQISPQLEEYEKKTARKAGYLKEFKKGHGDVCYKVIHDFIKMHYPEVYKHYPCTHKEWTTAIKNAKDVYNINTSFRDDNQETTDRYQEILNDISIRFPNFDDNTQPDDADFEP